MAEFDDSYNEKRDRIALEMAANGDQRARSALQRIIARDDVPDKRRQAEAMLARLDRESTSQSAER